MKKTISSSGTFFYKFIFPAMWFLGFGSGMLPVIFNENFQAVTPVAAVFIAGTIFIYWGYMRLKKVEMDDQYIYISNFSQEVRVHKSNIEKITENVFINSRPVWVHIKRPNEFGSKIMFMPKAKMFLMFNSHPVVQELREFAEGDKQQESI